MSARKAVRCVFVLAVIAVILVLGIACEWDLGTHCGRIYHCQGGPLFP